jgi:hypothetical protein
MEVNIWGLLGWTLYAVIIGCIVVPLIVRMTFYQVFEAINDSKTNYLLKLEQLYKTQEGESNGKR